MNRTSAPTWLAATGMVIAVIALWEPGTLALSGARYRLALSLPWWIVVVLATASLVVLLAFVLLLMATPRRKDLASRKPKPPPVPRLTPLALIMLVFPLVGMLGFQLIDFD